MKKFLVGIVAALMLFAFVACDNSVPTVSFKDVSYVEIEQVNNDLIVGEEAKATDFQVVVNYTEGNPIIIPGNENNIDLTTTAGFATYKGDSPFKNVYGQTVPVVPVAVEKQTIVSVSANVSTVELVENTSSAPSTVESPVLADPEALSDLKITLTGDAGATRTFTAEDISKKEITFVFSLYKDGKMLDRDYELKADETYNVTLDEYRFADDGAPDAAFNPGLETGVTVSVVKSEPASVVEYTMDYGDEGAWLKENISYEFTVVKSDETKNEVFSATSNPTLAASFGTSSTSRFMVVDYDDGDASTPNDSWNGFPEKYSANVRTIQFIDTKHPDKGRQTITIPRGADYTIGVYEDGTKFADSVTAATFANGNQEIQNNQILIYVEKASDNGTHTNQVSSVTLYNQSVSSQTWTATAVVTYPNEKTGETETEVINLSETIPQ